MKPTRIALLIALSTCFLVTCAAAQSAPQAAPAEFDHVTRNVRDLQKSAEFYDKVMQLNRMPDPFKDGQHVWYRVGAHEQLHLVGGATAVPPQPTELHVAFRVSSLADFMAHLDRMNVKYGGIRGGKVTDRPDGVRQIYFQDPDGYWIEVNDDKF
ncbi:MAG TPA: VOC family protein [Terriglobales bacterium]|nr:VOC family protein [Terriglobales bacterium]